MKLKICFVIRNIETETLGTIVVLIKKLRGRGNDLYEYMQLYLSTPQTVRKCTIESEIEYGLNCICHGLEDDDDFSLQPGYENFQAIEKDGLLAH